eukprot:CAMPEP_0114166238 /NCGR_PEP_ID=MMETSP0043_2-20121206/31722_1 /TAXON_ID=464988 /ORGANISM="Hemiselmis andersenii, Strain CCMP644" /LENGTH=335 /DNA_ID=CAMNT_0001263207 /DNA_START=59 /DNA_END=1066 /DNA_ORIENTATION=-
MSSTDSDIDIDKPLLLLLLQATGVGLGALSAAGLVCVMCSPHKATGVALRRGPLGVGGISATLACLSGGLGIGGGYSDSTWEFWGTVTSLTSSAVSLAAYIILTKCLAQNSSDTTESTPVSTPRGPATVLQFFGDRTINNHGTYTSNIQIANPPLTAQEQEPAASKPSESRPPTTSLFQGLGNLFRKSPSPKKRVTELPEVAAVQMIIGSSDSAAAEKAAEHRKPESTPVRPSENEPPTTVIQVPIADPPPLKKTVKTKDTVPAPRPAEVDEGPTNGDAATRGPGDAPAELVPDRLEATITLNVRNPYGEMQPQSERFRFLQSAAAVSRDGGFPV